MVFASQYSLLATVFGVSFAVSIADDNTRSIKQLVAPQNSTTGNYVLELRYNEIQSTQVSHKSNVYDINRHKQPTSQQNVRVISYPPDVKFYLYKNNILIRNGTNSTYLKIKDYKENRKEYEVIMTVNKSNVEDIGNYTLLADNGHKKENITFNIKFSDRPVMLTGNTTKECDLNTTISLECEVTGYPFPTITWSDNELETYESTSVIEQTEFRKKAILKVECFKDKTIVCRAHQNTAWNAEAPVSQITNLLVNEINNGFGINVTNDLLRILENETVAVKCIASKHKYQKLKWEFNDTEVMDNMVFEYNTSFSLVSILKLDSNSSQNVSGTYVCRAYSFNGASETEQINIIVDALSAPNIISNKAEINVMEFQTVNITCTAQSVPPSEIRWFKDGKELDAEQNITIQAHNEPIDLNTVTSVIHIPQMNDKYLGKYNCEAKNKLGNITKEVATLSPKKRTDNFTIITVVAVFVVLIGLVGFLVIKVRRDIAENAMLRKELKDAGLLNFLPGQTHLLNPKLTIDKQAELLPYDDRFEYPIDKLKIIKKLGSGAFGVVYEAEAPGIINANETTVVAVKMVERTACNEFIKALSSELKIMVHLGKHINIVNLLGACTKNISKRELSMILEYCKFGDIHTYMLKHRGNFTDMLSDSKENDFKAINCGFNSGTTRNLSECSTADVQNTESTSILTDSTNRHESVTEYQAWPLSELSTTRGSANSKDDRSSDPLTSKELLAWAFQIARGMEYLANRKILHGDLAARNVLLAEDNIVKICDFGLARSIMKNNQYKKQNEGLIPVKWVAIECVTEQIFSTQSDVWSFGVVLWELFTLGKTPYANIDNHELLMFLKKGHRLEKPPYSDDRIYNLMMQCWQVKPTARPSFSQLQKELGSFLEDEVRNHYISMNQVYENMNTLPEGQEDFLANVSAPDFNNVASSSHLGNMHANETNYVNHPSTVTHTEIEEAVSFELTPILPHTNVEDEGNSAVGAQNGLNSAIINPTYLVPL